MVTDKKMSIHHGKNISLFRTVKGLNQAGPAHELGEPWTQRKVSDLESREIVDDSILKELAPILGVSQEVLQSFKSDEGVFNYTNYFHDQSTNQGQNSANTINFNPIDKFIELYDKLLASEREKIEILKGTQK